MKSMGIYKIVHIESDKIYIGSSVNIQTRWIGHCRDLKKRRHHSIYLKKAWNKYAASSFKMEMIELVENRLQLLSRELSVERGCEPLSVPQEFLGGIPDDFRNN